PAGMRGHQDIDKAGRLSERRKARKPKKQNSRRSVFHRGCFCARRLYRALTPTRGGGASSVSFHIEHVELLGKAGLPARAEALELRIVDAPEGARAARDQRVVAGKAGVGVDPVAHIALAGLGRAALCLAVEDEGCAREGVYQLAAGDG